MAHAFPEKPSAEEQRQARNFAEALGYVLPCERCRKHYQDLYSKFGQSLELSREDMEDYYFQVHNAVNLATGKPSHTRDMYEESLREWKQIAAATATATADVHTGTEQQKQREFYWMIAFVVTMLLLLSALIYICLQSCVRGRGGNPGDVVVTEALRRGSSAGA
tara:strand:+ start:1693 stop:2184 length:492 start_codon:yes stop_codon:yes gene_type:complete